jgi:gas vesicle protein
MSTGKVVIGVLVGVSVGALFGILLAPDKGSSTRRKISKKSSAYFDDLNSKFDDFIDGISHKVENGKDELKKFIAKSDEKAQSNI